MEYFSSNFRSKVMLGLCVMISVVLSVACESSVSDQPATDRVQTVTQTSTRASESPEAQDPSALKVLALCRSRSAITTQENCRIQFENDGEMLGLGEPILFVTNKSGSSSNYMFRFDDNSDGYPVTDLDMRAAQLSPNVEYALQLRIGDGEWSAPFIFRMGELKPNIPAIEELCAGTECVSGGALTKPDIVGKDAMYPFVEFISGVAHTEQEFGWMEQSYLWAELMLDEDATNLGCLNCALAEARGYAYDARLPFGDTGLFYNWDLKNLSLGSHTLKVRLRNSKHVGEWSSPFTFKIVQ